MSESELVEEIAKRDAAEEMADALALEIGVLLRVEIGEHTNLNDPWRNALDAIRARNAR